MARDGGDLDDLGIARTVTNTDGAADMPPRATGSADPPEVDARYELRDELARGGGGRVMRAFDRKLGRDVALKFPHDDEEGGTLRRRLDREVKILAGLEHPAIVPIHDAGIWHNGQPYYAMRLLGGRTLRDAMKAARGFDERLGLLPVAEAIADAMAYAHGHGVIHRDLKPTNVIVGELGDTVVIDWGLAKRRDDAGADDETTQPRPRASDVAATLTATGAVMGTPAYMAPEQARGEPADARTDVYAIGVILYELLAGTRPYAADDVAGMIAKILDGPPPPLDEREPRVRAELAAIVAKAMAHAPRDRYPDAGGLAEDLRRYQAGRLVAAHRYSRIALAGRWLRRHAAVVAIGVAVAAVGAAAAAGWLSSRRPAAVPGAECANAGDRVRELWTPSRRAAIAAAFEATQVPYARSVANAVLGRIDEAAAALSDAYVEACRATRARGVQSDARLDLRIGCLDQQLAQLDATLTVLASADAKVVDLAPQAVAALDDPRVCADVAQLALVPPEPVDPAVRATLAGLRKRLAAAEAARFAGRGADVLDEVRAIAAAAEPIGYCPVTVKATYLVGRIMAAEAENQEQFTATTDLLQRAALDADTCGDDQTRANALLDLLLAWPSSDGAGRARLAAQAQAAAHRLTDPATEMRVLYAMGEHATEAGDLDRAIALLEQARAASTRLGGQDVTTIDFALASAYFKKGELDQAEAKAEVYLASRRREYGDDHPMIAAGNQVLAAIYGQRGDARRAIAMLEEVLRIRERAYGPEARSVLVTRSNLVGMLAASGEYARAAEMLEQGLPIAERILGPDDETVLLMAGNLAQIYAQLGRFDEALPRARAVLAARRRTAGPGHPATGIAQSNLGQALEDRGDHAAAVVELRAALAIERKELDEGGPEVNLTKAYLGMALLESGKPAEAIPYLRQALAVYRTVEDWTAQASTELNLARALWDTGGDRAEARALATAAAGRTEAQDKVRAAATAWLEAHR